MRLSRAVEQPPDARAGLEQYREDGSSRMGSVWGDGHEDKRKGCVCLKPPLPLSGPGLPRCHVDVLGRYCGLFVCLAAGHGGAVTEIGRRDKRPPCFSVTVWHPRVPVDNAWRKRKYIDDHLAGFDRWVLLCAIATHHCTGFLALAGQRSVSNPYASKPWLRGHILAACMPAS